MTRLKADLLLLLAAMIWGTAFVAQKTLIGMGPFEFVAMRFALSFIVVLPLALRENRKTPVVRAGFWPVFFLCASLTGGVIFQQIGVGLTMVTNAGFLTGLYVIFTPFMAFFILRRKAGFWVWPACILSVAALYFISGSSPGSMGRGDILIVICALIFAVQVTLTELIMERTSRPFFYSALQYAACAATAFVLACMFETVSLEALKENWVQIVYAGVLSSGIGYTLQAVAQQHTPSSEAAIIMSSEALFAAFAGALIMGDQLTGYGWLGCGLVMAAILMVEIRPLLQKR